MVECRTHLKSQPIPLNPLLRKVDWLKLPATEPVDQALRFLVVGDDGE
jgi:hypothetical protein